MKPIETPAYRPTPRCIWNSFRSSSKARLALSGSDGDAREALFAQIQKIAGGETAQTGSAGEDAFLVNMDAPFGSTGCVVMASGLGRRFGGNKLMAPFLGAPMICRVLSATEGIFARRVVVTRHGEVADLCRERGIEVVLHDLPLRSDAVRLGLEALGDVDACLFCPGDQPLLRRETVAALVLAGVNDRASIWRAAHGDAPGAPVLFPSWTFDELCALPDGRGGGYIAEKYAAQLRTLEVEDPFELMDADTPQALRLLQNHCLHGEVQP